MQKKYIDKAEMLSSLPEETTCVFRRAPILSNVNLTEENREDARTAYEKGCVRIEENKQKIEM